MLLNGKTTTYWQEQRLTFEEQRLAGKNNVWSGRTTSDLEDNHLPLEGQQDMEGLTVLLSRDLRLTLPIIRRQSMLIIGRTTTTDKTNDLPGRPAIYRASQRLILETTLATASNNDSSGRNPFTGKTTSYHWSKTMQLNSTIIDWVTS